MSMTKNRLATTVVAFPSRLGWMALIGAGETVRGLVFGYESSQTALAAIERQTPLTTHFGPWNEPLVERLQAYAEGQPDGFLDVEIDLGPQTAFQRRVIDGCRRIPFGQTLTYAQLATQVGYSGAARAVGNCMASNRVPLLIPCHRVVGSQGGLGGYSAPGGITLKRRLLILEGVEL